MMRLVILEPATPNWDKLEAAYLDNRPEPVRPPEPVETLPDNAAMWAATKNAVRGMLVDPDSAKIEPQTGFGLALFGNVHGNAICVYVNAKNRMGGYAGPQLYGVLLNRLGHVIKIDRNYASFDSHVEKECMQANLPPVNFVEDEPGQIAAGSPPIASQIQSLADLHQRGLLTDAEFTAAKAKLLGAVK